MSYKRKHPWKWKDSGRLNSDVRDSELHIGPLRLIVHRRHGFDPTQWFGSCYELQMTDKALLAPGASLDSAKKEWLEQVAAHVAELYVLLHDYRGRLRGAVT